MLVLTDSRYTELQPVGMGAFGLVWYVALYVAQDISKTKYILTRPLIPQFGQRPIDRTASRSQENHEAVQYPRSVQANLPRAEAAQTSSPRERPYSVK